MCEISDIILSLSFSPSSSSFSFLSFFPLLLLFSLTCRTICFKHWIREESKQQNHQDKKDSKNSKSAWMANNTCLIIFLTCSGGISSFCVSTNPNFLLSLYRFEFSCCHFLAFSSSLASASASVSAGAGGVSTVYDGCAAGGGGINEPVVPGGAIWPLFHILNNYTAWNLEIRWTIPAANIAYTFRACFEHKWMSMQGSSSRF